MAVAAVPWQAVSEMSNCVQPLVLSAAASALELTGGSWTVALAAAPSTLMVQVFAVISPWKVIVPSLASAVCAPARIPAAASRPAIRDSFMVDSVEIIGKLAYRWKAMNPTQQDGVYG